MKRKNVEERFWGKVNKDGPIAREELGQCWVWTGSRCGKNYGHFRINGKVLRSHQAVIIITLGYIPPDKQVLHYCDNPPCCRPSHLWFGTNQDNVDDKMKKGRHGHGIGNARLKETEVISIRREYSTGNFTLIELGEKYGVTNSAIWRIAHGKNWKRL